MYDTTLRVHRFASIVFYNVSVCMFIYVSLKLLPFCGGNDVNVVYWFHGQMTFMSFWTEVEKAFVQ